MDDLTQNVIWILWLLLFGVFETLGILSKKPGDTLSERTREWFRTEKSAAGRRAFGFAWVAFASWFLWHILWQHPTGPLS